MYLFQCLFNLVLKYILKFTFSDYMLQFRSPTIFKLFRSLPFHIFRLLSMQDQVVKQPEQL
jgi:hypothetical protein